VKQDELSKARVIAEAEMTLEGCQPIDINIMASYVTDLRNILDESRVAQRKAFLRSFVKKIVVEKERVKLYYNLPVPPDGKKMDTVGVLPIDTPSGEEGTRTRPATDPDRMTESKAPAYVTTIREFMPVRVSGQPICDCGFLR
jgi:hypothetical protein